MAINVNRNPDYSDIDLDWVNHPATGDLVRKTGEEAIKRSVRNLILTNFYEHPFRSNIGSNAQKLLFELINPLTATFLASAIKEVIVNFEPRVVVNSVTVKVTEDQNSYMAVLSYTISNRLEPTIQSFILERIR